MRRKELSGIRRKLRILNYGIVERSHLTDRTEFYQPIEYVDDINIQKKFAEGETFFNIHRPNGALKGQTPYAVLKEKLALYSSYWRKFYRKRIDKKDKFLTLITYKDLTALSTRA